MKKVSITEARINLASLIDGLKRGSPVLIVDRGRVVARLEPMTSGREPDDEGRLLRLIRAGIVRAASAPLSRHIFAYRPPRLRAGASAVAMLIEERNATR